MQQIYQSYRLRRFDEALSILQSSPHADPHDVWLLLMITGRTDEAGALAASELKRDPEFFNRPRNLFRSLGEDVANTAAELLNEMFPADE